MGKGIMQTFWSIMGEILCLYLFYTKLNKLFKFRFVYPENETYDYSIKLSVSQSDPLLVERTKLLALLDLKPADTFKVAPVLTKEVLAFVRVFQMNKGRIEWISCELTLKTLRTFRSTCILAL